MSTNQTLLMDPGASLTLIPQTTTSYYAVILSNGANHTSVVGGTIIGDRNTRFLNGVPMNSVTYINGVGTDFENGSCVWIFLASGSIVLGTTIKDCTCDGIDAWGGVNVLVSDVVASNNRRDGISLEDNSNNVTIQYSSFSNTNGNDPGCGIDVEGADVGIKNVLVQNSTFTGNAGGGVLIGAATAPTSLITVDSCQITGNGGSNYEYGGIKVVTWYDTFPTTNCTLTNNTVSGNLTGDGIEVDDVSNVTVEGNTVTDNAGCGLSLNSCQGAVEQNNTVTGNSGGQTCP
jgi:parallel beta-helix repeat protein